MKKTISLILVICLVAGLFSGCFFRRTSPEEDLINMQTGGYLYTQQVRADTRDERTFLNERKKTISEMVKRITKTADHCFSVTDGFEKYENNLIKYIKKIPDFNNDTSAVISAMLQKMTAYKVLLGSYEDQIKQFNKMKSDSAAVESAINTFMWDTVYTLVDTQNEYLSWLTQNTGTVISLLGIASRQSERLLSTSQSIYNKNLSGAFEKMLAEYDAASVYNTLIQSADYYASQFYIDGAKENIQAIKDSGQTSDDALAELEEVYSNALKATAKPPLLVPVPDKQSFSLARRVSAESETPPLAQAILVLSKDIDNSHENSVSSVSVDEFKAAAEQSAAETQSDYDSQMKAVTKQHAGAAKLSDDAKNANDAADIAAKKRAEAIKNISNLQTGLSISGAITGPEFSYSAAVYAITKFMQMSRPELLSDAEKDQLREDGKTESDIQKIDEQTIKTQELLSQAVTLINTELNALIGDNVKQFFTLLTTKAAEEFYNDFQEWKEEIGELTSDNFTKDNLENLLIKMGADFIKSDEDIDVKIPDSIPSTDTTAPSASAGESPSVSETPIESTEPNLPTESNETTDNFGIARITGNWQTIREIDPSLDNASIIYTIYGWSDLLDYSEYEKKEISNKDGELTRIQYMDANNKVVGWEIRFYDERIEYSYHFPDDKDHDFEITRLGTVEKNYLYQIQTEDETINRVTSIRFNEAGHPETEEKIKILTQRQDGQRDGLNLTAYNSNPTYAVYDMEEMWESYTYKDGVLVRELESSHKSSDIETSIKEYYDSGNIKREFTELNGDEHGLYTAYYENGKTQNTRNYKKGEYHGSVETFYEDGHTDDLKNYEEGELHGITYGYYPEGIHFLRYEGEYANGLENGVFKSYSNQGSLNTEVEYKDGIKNGIFRDYLIDDEIHTSSYHVFGQYNEGKRTGIWEFGRDNITWIEQVYYEEDVKVWTQYSDSNIRTFYKPNGEIDHTEVMN